MKTGKHFPCQDCGELQYRRPYRAKQVEAGTRQCWCRPCWIVNMQTWSKNRPQQIDFARTSREENWGIEYVTPDTPEENWA